MIKHLETQRKRLVENPNLNLHYDNRYLGLPVQTSAGPLVKEWLERIRLSIMEQLAKHSRVLARISHSYPASLADWADDRHDRSVADMIA